MFTELLPVLAETVILRMYDDSKPMLAGRSLHEPCGEEVAGVPI